MADELERRCRDCQKRLEDDPKRSVKFGAEHPGCACDQVSISLHSPGRIEDRELLARVVIEPKNVNNEDGTIEAASLREALTYGLSLQRREYVNNSELRKFGEKLAAG